jgi:hypothetical protein
LLVGPLPTRRHVVRIGDLGGAPGESEKDIVEGRTVK